MMDKTRHMLVRDTRYDLMLDYNAILNNISTHMQYYSLERSYLDIKQIVQLYISQDYEFRVGELRIIKKRNLNIDPIILNKIKKEVLRNNFPCKQWNINFVDEYIDELKIDYNRFLSIKQREEYNLNNKRIKSKKKNPSSNMLIGYN